MEYNSFYGGRRGASFVIVKKYRCIQEPAEDNENMNRVIRVDLGYTDMTKPISAADRNKWLAEHCMVTGFSQGGAYKTVNYDEYVIIDTLNLNDADNGKIFRRGYDYNNSMGGAEYIGQIVGPAGMSPHVEMKTIAEVDKIIHKDGLTKVEGKDNEYVEKDESGADKYYYRTSTGEYAPLENLIPGKYWDEDGNEQFNDEIKYLACSVMDCDSHETTVHIGFKIPYQVQEYTAETVSPYYHRSDLEPSDLTGDAKWEKWDEVAAKEYGDGTTNFNNLELIKRIDDVQHPFFARWNISVPKGIKGDTLKNFRVTTVAECEAEHPGWLQDYAGMSDDKVTEAIKKERKILVYDYYDYDRDPSGDPISIYLGDYNQISNFQINDYGTVTIDYSHDDEDVYKNLFKWIKSISLDENTGRFIIEYNYDKTRDGEELAKEDTKLDINLTWLKDMTFAEDGTVKWIYTTSENDHQKDNFIKWITSVTLDVENGQLDVDFNYPTEPDYKENAGEDTHYRTSLQWVKDVLFAEDGTVTIKYTNKEDTVLTNRVKWVTDVALNANTGLFEMDFNYETEADGTPTHFEQSLKWVKDITIDEYGTIHFIYTNQDDTILKNHIKWIKDIEYTADTGELIVNFNYDKTRDGVELAKEDTQYVTHLRYVKDIQIEDNGTIKFIYTYGDEAQGTITTFDNYLKRINEVSLNGETGHFEVIYNYDREADGTPTKYQTDLRWVNNITLSETGVVTLKYTTGPDVTLNQKIKWITDVELSNDGTLTVTYNDKTTDIFTRAIKWITDISLTDAGVFTVKYNNGIPDFTKTLKWPTNITIDTGEIEGSGTQKFSVEYNDGSKADLGNPINYIMRTAIDDEYHLLVLYSDPVRRAAGPNKSYDGIDDWCDLGFLGQGSLGCITGKESDATVAALAATLPPYSTWIIVEED